MRIWDADPHRDDCALAAEDILQSYPHLEVDGDLRVLRAFREVVGIVDWMLLHQAATYPLWQHHVGPDPSLMGGPSLFDCLQARAKVAVTETPLATLAAEAAMLGLGAP